MGGLVQVDGKGNVLGNEERAGAMEILEEGCAPVLGRGVREFGLG